MAIFIGKFFIADYIPCSLTADAMKANCTLGMSVLHTFLYCSRRSQLEKNFQRKMAVDILFQRKKTELKNRAKCVGVLSSEASKMNLFTLFLEMVA
jgi:hypothetical protein